MTANIKGLQKRLNKLEISFPEPDYEQQALDSLSNEDLDALQEACCLYQSGYSESEVKDMMGERWPQVEIAIARCNDELTRLMQNEGKRPKRLVDHETGPILAPVNYRAGKRVP